MRFSGNRTKRNTFSGASLVAEIKKLKQEIQTHNKQKQ